MFLDIDKRERNIPALIDDSGAVLTYGELAKQTERIGGLAEKRALVFCLCKNCIGAAIGYFAFLNGGQVPLLLGNDLDESLLNTFTDTYRPAYLWYPEGRQLPIAAREIESCYGYVLARTEEEIYPMHAALSMLLPTSGSTGEPKLVRHRLENVTKNARNVSVAFGIQADDRALLSLPMQYTMGLNVMTSHIYSGATVVLTEYGLASMDFYRIFKERAITSYTGVPYCYEILSRLRFVRSEWPSLRTLSVGGGRLSDKLINEFAGYCERNGKAFISSFGQTECTARMAMLPPEMALKKVGSIGKAIPEGRLYLIDEAGNELSGAAEGEMCYEGPNVTMGYAQCKEDLLKGDEWHGVRHTGDIAKRDEDGYYFITGRISRFLKLFGIRISLDQMEKSIAAELNTECACAGTDKKMRIYLTDATKADAAVAFASATTGVLRSAFGAVVVDEIPKNATGKVLYAKLPAE